MKLTQLSINQVELENWFWLLSKETAAPVRSFPSVVVASEKCASKCNDQARAASNRQMHPSVSSFVLVAVVAES